MINLMWQWDVSNNNVSIYIDDYISVIKRCKQ